MRLTELAPACAKATRIPRGKSAMVSSPTRNLVLGTAQAVAKAGAHVLFNGFALVAFASAISGNAQANVTMSKEILSVQIRKVGFTCTNPVSAVRDVEHSRPGHTVWLLSCENCEYRVDLVPS